MRLIKNAALTLLVLIVVATVTAWFLRVRLLAQIVGLDSDQIEAQYLAASPESEILKKIDQIEKDGKALERMPIFGRASKGAADAAPFFNPLVPTDPPMNTSLALPIEIEAQLKNQDFKSLKLDWKKASLDFSWLKKLRDFDYWAYDLYPPFLLEENETMAAMRVVDYSQLFRWAKLRLLYGRDHGDLREAIFEVQHLAELIFTQDELLAAMSSVAMVGITTLMYPDVPAAPRAKLPFQNWKDGNRLLARRYLWAQNSILDPRLSDKTFERIQKWEAGRCLRLKAGAFNDLGFRNLLRPRLEKSYQRMDKALALGEAKCRPNAIYAAWKNPGYEAIFKADEDIFATAAILGNSADRSPSKRGIKFITIKDIERYPFYAANLGFRFELMGRPDALKEY